VKGGIKFLNGYYDDSRVGDEMSFKKSQVLLDYP
jgi:hypothetical protein